MNQKLTDRLDTLTEKFNAAESLEALTSEIVEVERLVLKSNYEDRQSGASQSCVTQPFEVGGANTRGLSWKLNLLRAITDATFVKMVRTGVHGGGTNLHGYQDNIDAALAIYEAAYPALEKLAGPAHQAMADGPQEEGSTPPHRVGWINQWLVNAPADMSAALAESRADDASKNGKVANAIAEITSDLNVYVASKGPQKSPKAPKDPNAPKTRRSRKAKGDVDADGNISANGASENTEDDDSDAYPEVTYADVEAEAEPASV